MGSESGGKSFLKNTSFVTLGWLSNITARVVVSIFIARFLGPEGKGQIALALSTGAILGHFLCLGFDRATPYFLASKKVTDNKVFGSWILAVIIGSVIAYGVVYPLIAAYLMDNVFSGVSKSLLLLAGLSCPLYFLRLLVNTILAGHEEFFRQTCHNIAICAASITAVFVAMPILHLAPIGYVGIHLALGGVSLFYGFFVLRRVICLTPEFNWRDWFTMFRYGIKAALSQVFNLIDLQLDIYIVNYFVGLASVGIYTVAASLGSIFWILPTSVASVLFPRVASSKPEESKRLTAFLCRNFLWQTIFIGLLFLLVSKWLIVLVFGEDFASASLVLALLMPGVLARVVSKICYTDCYGRGFPEKVTISVGVTASLTVIFDLLLIPRYGMYGAAVASSIAYCAGGVLGLYWHMKLSGNVLSALIIPKRSDLRYYKSIIENFKRKIF